MDYLVEMGIESVYLLFGVGQNLQDYLVILVVWKCFKLIMLVKVELIVNFVKMVFFKCGMLMLNVVEVGGFFQIDQDFGKLDMQFYFVLVIFIEYGFEEVEEYGFIVVLMLVVVCSCGEIKFKLKEFVDVFWIQFNYFFDLVDFELLVEGVKVV